MQYASRKLDIVLPAFNEASTISATIEAFASVAPEARFIVIDNASTDNTKEVARRTFERLSCNFEIVTCAAKGKGNATREGFNVATGDVVIIADADATYPADQINDLLTPILTGQADMVVGDRLSRGHYEVGNHRKFHGIGNRAITKIVNRLFHTNLADVLSGYRAFSARFIRTYPVTVSGFELEVDMTLHALDKNLRIVEIPISYRDRPEGSESKLQTWSDGFLITWTIFQLLRLYKPLFFFGLASAGVLVLALVSGAFPIYDYIQFRYVYRVPLAIMAVGLGILSVLFLGIGLILDNLAREARRNFQLLLRR